MGEAAGARRAGGGRSVSILVDGTGAWSEPRGKPAFSSRGCACSRQQRKPELGVTTDTLLSADTSSFKVNPQLLVLRTLTKPVS